MNNTSTKEAKIKKLSHCDVYSDKHIMYVGEVYRNYTINQLRIEAINAFSDTITFSKKEENSVSIIDNPPPKNEIIEHIVKFRYLEYFKISAAFEMYLKAELLAGEYIVHEIDKRCSSEHKEIYKRQKKEPIKIEEFLKITGFHFNGKENYLPGIKDFSLSFKTLIKNKYTEVLSLEHKELEVIKEYNRLRNRIHFPSQIRVIWRYNEHPTPNIEIVEKIKNKIENSIIKDLA